MKRSKPMLPLWLLLPILWALAPNAIAHELRPAYLELRQTAPDTFSVLWKVPARGDDLRLGIYVRLPESAQNISEPRGVFAGTTYVERWTIREPNGLVGSTIHIDGLSTMLTDVLVRIERLDGVTQIARLMPTSPSMLVKASPPWWESAWTYGALGVDHILLGVDHLLFVLALLLLVRGGKRLVGAVTAFTIAHSITLALASLGVVHVPGPPVEACIALSIVFVASEILHSRAGRRGLTERAPWIVAFIFGLLHGLGFAGALSETGLPEGSIVVSLLFFNLGVEAGQLAFIALVMGAVILIKRARPSIMSSLGWLPPYLVGSVAMFWVIERVAGF